MRVCVGDALLNMSGLIGPTGLSRVISVGANGVPGASTRILKLGTRVVDETALAGAGMEIGAGPLEANSAVLIGSRRGE